MGATDTTLTQVDSAIADLLSISQSGDAISTVARAANAISAPMPDLFALYSPILPPELLAMDYQGREIVLDGMDLDFAAAQSDVSDLESTWQTVRQQVVDAGGTTEVDDFDASVANLLTMVDTEDAEGLMTEANVNLDLVDVLEGLFE